MVQTPEREKPALSKHSHVDVTVSLDIRGSPYSRLRSPVQGVAPSLGYVLLLSIPENKVGVCPFLPGYFYIQGFAHYPPK